MHLLFANTGVQILCFPLRGGNRYSATQIGYGFQRCRTAAGVEGQEPKTIPYLQWQIVQGTSNRLFLAVETTCGDPEAGYFCEAGTLIKDFHIRLEGMVDLAGQPLKGLPPIELVIRPVTAIAGDAKAVHMVLDFGNSRTGGLLLELSGEISQTPHMMPFELVNRYHLDAWNDQGQFTSTPASRWFSSKTHWCNTPYLPPLAQKRIEYHMPEEEEKPATGWFGRTIKPKPTKVEVTLTPSMFDDLSMVRLGREADDMIHVIRADGDIRTGVSSPKRYLWADDASWLEGANWFMADPTDRARSGRLRRAAGRAVPAIRPRGRPRFPSERRRSQGERVRHGHALEATSRPAGP